MTTEQRLERLESQCKRQRLAVGFLTIVLCGVVSMGATKSHNAEFNHITAKGLYIENDDGRTVVTIGYSANGDGVLTTYSKDGDNLVELGTVMGEYGRIVTGKPFAVI